MDDIIRHKTQLVAKGHFQVARVDITKPLSPWPNASSLGVFLIIGAIMNWEYHQMDVNTHF